MKKVLLSVIVFACISPAKVCTMLISRKCFHSHQQMKPSMKNNSEKQAAEQLLKLRQYNRIDVNAVRRRFLQNVREIVLLNQRKKLIKNQITKTNRELSWLQNVFENEKKYYFFALVERYQGRHIEKQFNQAKYEFFQQQRLILMEKKNYELYTLNEQLRWVNRNKEEALRQKVRNYILLEKAKNSEKLSKK